MKVYTAVTSRFLSHPDVATPLILTIDRWTFDATIHNPNIVHFVGDVKPLPLNKTNLRIIVAAYGDETDAWHGKPLEVYFDPSVNNPRTPNKPGGIKVRIPATVQVSAVVVGAAPTPTPAAAPAPAQKPETIGQRYAKALTAYANAESRTQLDALAKFAKTLPFTQAHHEGLEDMYHARLAELDPVQPQSSAPPPLPKPASPARRLTPTRA